jgi:hybrid cluster-associated redox disulfide protein
MIKKVTKDTNIQELINNHPEVSSVFMKYGMMCFGCALSSGETLQEGAAVHGINKKFLKEIIKELNKTLNEEDKDQFMFITSRAANQISKLMKKSKSKFLRIRIIDSKYGFSFTNKKTKKDILIEKGKVKFLIDKKYEFLRGSTLDYLSSSPKNGFKFYPKRY